MGRRLRKNQSLILAYHNILPDDGDPSGDLSLHLSRDSFRAQLDRLGETHDIVSLPELTRANEPSSRPRAVITFDDAYRGAVTMGVEELAQRSLPATIFVPPGQIGSEAFWWDALAGPGRAGLKPAHRVTAIESLDGDGARILEWARSEGLSVSSVPHHSRPATLEELQQAAATTGITIGSHSWSHRSLPSLSSSECASELRRSMDWLRDNLPGFIPWLAYPYGLFDPKVAEQAAEAGYEGAVTTVPGWSSRPLEERYSLPRITIPAGLTLAGLELRGAGILGS